MRRNIWYKALVYDIDQTSYLRITPLLAELQSGYCEYYGEKLRFKGTALYELVIYLISSDNTFAVFATLVKRFISQPFIPLFN